MRTKRSRAIALACGACLCAAWLCSIYLYATGAAMEALPPERCDSAERSAITIEVCANAVELLRLGDRVAAAALAASAVTFLAFLRARAAVPQN